MKHNHLNISVIEQQLAYENSAACLITARNLIGAKIRNQGMFLTSYARARAIQGFVSGRLIQLARRQIISREGDLRFAMSKQHIFQIEARASRSYWDAVRILCKQDANWHRIYPRAHDPLNQAPQYRVHFAFSRNLEND